ncbi:DUF1266 domain-containing protein [Amycolatopsis vastitatis]|uniref:DUF1266 domain-containing protein n=1 Tax=Amycolatopsis vastitatis TaxID=1905142 RepID=A0A229SN64_9PSEU|nr:DUF1266 domain-containing protein [Amycolatopsis vastitatis]OXM60234.1 hypothetical protein CF165_43180 [Amycolatopsis vastitatis]
MILPPPADLEAQLTAARRDGDLDRYLGLLAGEELFVPIRRVDARSILDERAETFPNVYFETGGDEFLQVFTRGALPDLGPDVVAMSGALDWAVDGVGRHERVVFNRGTRAEWRLPGATLQPWLDAHLDDVTPLDEQVERLITAPYGQLEGPIAHALACGAHLAVLNAAPWNTLDGRYHDYVAEVRSLRDWWGVPDPPGWRTTMAGLIGDGYALTPGNLALMLRLRFAAEYGLPGGEFDPVTWAELADRWCEENDAADQAAELRHTVRRVSRYEQRFRADGLLDGDGFVTTTLSWDVGRAVAIARGGLAAGYCDALTAELMVLEAGALARRYHQSWADLSAGYVMGRLLHGDEDEFGEWYAAAVRVHHQLLQDPASPWLNLGFGSLSEESEA